MDYHLLFLLAAIAISGLMHFHNLSKCKSVAEHTKGVISGRHDLLLVRDAINLSMKLAIYYIALFFFLITVLGYWTINGYPFFAAVGHLFLFGVVTLPMGLIGKYYEDRLRKMTVQPSDPELEATYRRYLVQWQEPRFSLPD